MFNKASLRKEYLAKRKSLTALEQHKLNDLMLIQLQSLSLPEMETLLSYVPMEERAEPDTFLFSDYLQFVFPDLKIAYPVTNMETETMEAFICDENTVFEKVDFGLIEPISQQQLEAKSIDAVIVPLLIADQQGFRVGYGKGMYDKFLEQCRKDVYRIGFSFFEPIEQILDIDKNDIPLDVLICPFQTFKF